MLHQITKDVREFLAAQISAVGAKSGRAADRESALLWLLQNTGNAWGVCVTVNRLTPNGTEQDRRNGRCSVLLTFYLGMTPGLPADADARAENLHLAWLYVWSYVTRMRWGRLVPVPGVPGANTFEPREGFLDGNRPMVPAEKAEFTRVTLQVTGPDGKKQDARELLLATQSWLLEACLPVIGMEADSGEDFYLSGDT